MRLSPVFIASRDVRFNREGRDFKALPRPRSLDRPEARTEHLWKGPIQPEQSFGEQEGVTKRVRDVTALLPLLLSVWSRAVLMIVAWHCARALDTPFGLKVQAFYR